MSNACSFRQPLSVLFPIALATLAAFQACPCRAQSVATARDAVTFHRMAPVFVENRGQWDGDFAYRLTLGPMAVFVQRNGWTFTLLEPAVKPTDLTDSTRARRPSLPESARGVAISMHFSDGAY